RRPSIGERPREASMLRDPGPIGHPAADARRTPPSAAFRKEDIEQSIPERFEEQVRRHPERLAVSDGTERLSYAELNRAANRVAPAILARERARDAPVALLLDRGAGQIAAILGVLKTGRIYVPLDPTLPRARLAEILADSEAGLVVVDGRN